jgi:hypothetical protein
MACSQQRRSGIQPFNARLVSSEAGLLISRQDHGGGQAAALVERMGALIRSAIQASRSARV